MNWAPLNIRNDDYTEIFTQNHIHESLLNLDITHSLVLWPRPPTFYLMMTHLWILIHSHLPSHHPCFGNYFKDNLMRFFCFKHCHQVVVVNQIQSFFGFSEIHRIIESLPLYTSKSHLSLVGHTISHFNFLYII